MTDSNRPRHALDDDAPEAETLGLPLRGLAMILLAVAVLLIAWGVYSLTGNGSDDSSQASQTQQTSQAENGQNKQGEQDHEGQQDKQDGQDREGHDAASEEQGDHNNDAHRDAPQRAGEGAGQQAPAGGQGNGGAAAGGGVNKNDTYIAVVNNSPISGLAGDVAGKMRDQQWTKTGVGNLPGEAGVFPTSVVLYPKGNDAERQTAEQLAKDLGIKAQERDERIDRSLSGVDMLEGERPAGVVVVTTNDMPR